MKTVKRFLAWSRFTDEDGNLSITHACLLFACVLMWRGTAVSLTEFGTFALALGGYQAKKILTAQSERSTREPPAPAPAVDLGPLSNNLAVVEAKVKELSSHVATILNKPALERFGLAPRKP